MANKGSKEAGEQDKLFPMSLGEREPATVRGSDFPNKGGSGMGAKPGHDELMPQSEMQEYPSYNESEGGMHAPADWGRGGEQFKVMTSTGEGAEPTSKMSISESVDMVSGKLMCSGYKPTPAGEVGQYDVTIGR